MAGGGGSGLGALLGAAELPPWEVVVKLVLLQTGLTLLGGLALAKLMAWRGAKRFPRVTSGAVLLTGGWVHRVGLRWIEFQKGLFIDPSTAAPAALCPLPTYARSQHKPLITTNRDVVGDRADGGGVPGPERIHGAGGRAQGKGRAGAQGCVRVCIYVCIGAFLFTPMYVHGFR